MQNTIHPRDLIVGLQKGLALIQLFSKTCPKLTVAQAAKMSGLTQSAARRFLLTLLHERYLQTDGRSYWLNSVVAFPPHGAADCRIHRQPDRGARLGRGGG